MLHIKKNHLLTSLLLLCVAPIKSMETRLVQLIPTINGVEIKNGPLVPYDVALQSKTFKTMMEDGQLNPEEKNIQFSINNYSRDTAQNIAACLKIEKNGTSEEKRLLFFYLNALPTNQLIDLINVTDFINTPLLQRKLITYFYKKQLNDHNVSENLPLLEQGPQNIVLAQLLKEQNYATQIIENYVGSLKNRQPLPIDQPQTSFLYRLFNPYAIVIKPCYYNLTTGTIISFSETATPDLGINEIIMLKKTQPITMKISQYNIYKILNITANKNETFLHIQADNWNRTNVKNFFINLNTQQPNLIEINIHQRICLTKNKSDSFYYINNPNKNADTLKNSGGICIAKTLVENNYITFLSSNDDGDIIALCSDNKIFTITNPEQNDILQEIDTNNIDFSTTDDNKTKEIHSVILNHTGDKLLVVITEHTDFNNHGDALVNNFNFSELWLIDLTKNETKQIILPLNNDPYCKFLSAQFTEDDKFIIFSDYTNTYHCYDTQTEISFKQSSKTHYLTADGKAIIIQIANREFATQEIISNDTEKLLQLFGNTTQNTQQELNIYEKMKSNGSQQTRQNIASDILNKPVSFWSKLRLNPYLTGIASLSLCALIIGLGTKLYTLNEFVYTGITHY